MSASWPGCKGRSRALMFRAHGIPESATTGRRGYTAERARGRSCDLRALRVDIGQDLAHVVLRFGEGRHAAVLRHIAGPGIVGRERQGPASELFVERCHVL